MIQITLLLLLTTMLGSWEMAVMSFPMLTLWTASLLYSPLAIPFFSSPLLSMDPMSSMMIMLTLWTSGLMLLSSMKIHLTNTQEKKFCRTINVLTLTLVLAFMTSDLLNFYILFETALIPTLMLILIWGYQPERIQAGYYLMIYTITASLPLFSGILYMLNSMTSISFHLPITTILPKNTILNMALITAFLVKMPIYPFHLWLPKAHVEAPVSGSMILASILLKLGSYGLLRISMMYPSTLNTLQQLIMFLSLWGAALTSIQCIRQQDLKSLIAYASVGHMGILTAGIYSNSSWGMMGALVMMIAHGLASSGLFSLANMYYENSKTRNIFLTSGLLTLFPMTTLCWFMMLMANMATPPTLNFLAEVLLFISVSTQSYINMYMMMISSFFTVCYSSLLYTSLFHGHPRPLMNHFCFPRLNLTISLLHIIPLFLLTPCTSLMMWT